MCLKLELVPLGLSDPAPCGTISTLWLHKFDYEDVVFKVSFFSFTVSECHLTVAVLDTILPVALVTAAIGPGHFTVPVSLVIFKLSLVKVASAPCKRTFAVFLIM